MSPINVLTLLGNSTSSPHRGRGRLKVIRRVSIRDPTLRPAINAQGVAVRVVCMQSHQTSVHRRPKLTPYHPLPRCRSARGVHAKSSDECPSTTQAYALPSTPKVNMCVK
mmetsp:Transcript_20411/g.46853  ORF Transcript_20411/g.46853 Transcript_20411/m.46853 type:complete len:110 (-) Transcript_20411:1156-1485(-)